MTFTTAYLPFELVDQPRDVLALFVDHIKGEGQSAKLRAPTLITILSEFDATTIENAYAALVASGDIEVDQDDDQNDAPGESQDEPIAAVQSDDAAPTVLDDYGPLNNGEPVATSDAGGELVALLNKIVKPAAQAMDPQNVRSMVQAEIAKALDSHHGVTRLEVRTIDSEAFKALGLCHSELADLIVACSTRIPQFLVGPAGSGKTTAAQQVAEALGLAFYFNGAIDTEYKLKGFVDAQGRLISTAFREAYESGGVYLFDEVDASLPAATMAFNSALANGYCDFPDGRVEAHADFVCIAAGNTWGTGATFEFVGRNKQDAAFMDRFAMLAWPIDEAMEREACPDKDWVKYVQAVRSKAASKGLRVVISPRASFYGARLLAAGLSRNKVEAMTLKKGMTDDQWSSIK